MNATLKLIAITKNGFEGCILNTDKKSVFNLQFRDKPLSESLQLWTLLLFSIAYRCHDIRNSSEFEVSIADIAKYTQKGHDIVKKELIDKIAQLQSVKCVNVQGSGYVFDSIELDQTARPIVLKVKSEYFKQLVNVLCSKHYDSNRYWYSGTVDASILGSRTSESAKLSVINLSAQMSKSSRNCNVKRKISSLVKLCPDLQNFLNGNHSTSNKNKKVRVYTQQVLRLLTDKYIPGINKYTCFTATVDNDILTIHKEGKKDV